MVHERFRLYVITDDADSQPEALALRLTAALRGGATAIQLREKHAGTARLARLIELMAPACCQHSALLMLNAQCWHPSLPLSYVDGLHVQAATWPPAPDSPLGEWLRSRPELLLIYSAHTLDEIERLESTGIHGFTLSPIFETPSKAHLLAPRGVGVLRQARRRFPSATLIGLGGIDAQTVSQVIQAGADGIAVIRAVLAAPDPEAAARQLRSKVEAALGAQEFPPAGGA